MFRHSLKGIISRPQTTDAYAAGLIPLPHRNIFISQTTIKKTAELVRALKMSVPEVSDCMLSVCLPRYLPVYKNSQ